MLRTKQRENEGFNLESKVIQSWISKHVKSVFSFMQEIVSQGSSYPFYANSEAFLSL